MLSLLHIENIAVVERADIEFGPHLNVLTGETGAGKSIIIDSINAILGMRTPRDLVRTGAGSASVSAVFENPTEQVTKWLEENCYESDEDDGILIQRQISSEGRNVCKLNGKPINVTLLRKLGSKLVNIHGQHDSQQLLDDSCHIGYLDSFAGHTALQDEMKVKYSELSSIRAEIRKLSIGEEEKRDRMDALSRRIAEIEEAELTEGEEEELTERRHILRNSEKITRSLQAAFVAMYGDDESYGAYSMISDAAESLSSLSHIGTEFSALLSRANELKFAAEDITDELMQIKDSYEYSSEEMDYVESRLELINSLERKYGASISAVLSKLSEYQNELDKMTFSDAELDRLRKRESEALAAAEETASKLTQSRKEAAKSLSERIMKELQELNMRARFTVSITPDTLSQDGSDAVSFLFSANAGEEPKELSKIASGGELSRVMLAMKGVLAENDDVQTLIFDEVDSGVSGRAAQKVAEKLAKLGRLKQTLCVTHLPQLASMADQHFLIEKREKNDRTYTSVAALDYDGRAEELARIIGGSSITETTLESAREMIVSAGRLKESYTI